MNSDTRVGRRESRRARNLAAGLRLLAGGAIVFASLGLVVYAGRVDAAWPGGAVLNSPPLLAWMPFIVLAFVLLPALAWRLIHARAHGNHHRPSDAGGDNDRDTTLFTSAAESTRNEASDWSDKRTLEHFPAIVSHHFFNCKKQSTCLALTVVAIDDLGRLADAIGQESLDERMHQTGLSLQSLVRSQGGVFAGPQAQGGRHYLALLPNTDPDRALQLSEDMRMTVEDLGYETPIPPRTTMTASLGLAVMVPDDQIPQSALFNAAEQALQRSQRHGGNRVEVEMIDGRPERQ